MWAHACLVRTNPGNMKTTPFATVYVDLPYLVPRRADWTLRSRAAVGRAEGGRVKVAIGTGAVDRGSRNGEHVEVFLLPSLTDEQMQTLAAGETAGAPLTTLTGTFRLLVGLGLSQGNAGLVLGLPGPAEVSRLNKIAALPPRVLSELARLGLTRNHARWLLNLPEATVLKGLLRLEEDLHLPNARAPTGSVPSAARHKRRRGALRQVGISVDEVRAWRATLSAPPAPAPPQAVVVAASNESARLQEVLGAPALVEAFANTEARRLRLEFFSVEDLAGLFERMGRASGEGPAPPKGAGMRRLTIDEITDDELAYLVGRSDD